MADVVRTRARFLTSVLALTSCLVAGAISAPSASAQSPDDPAVIARSIFLPMEVEGTVQQIDPVEHRVVRTIDGLGSNPFVLQELPDHSKIYASRLFSLEATLPVIDKRSGRVIKNIPTVGAPYTDMRTTADGSELYLSTTASVVQVVDTKTDTIARTLPIVLPPAPGHIEVSPDNKTLYVLSEAGVLTRYDAHTGALIGQPLLLGDTQTGWGALNRAGDTMYVRTLSGVRIVDLRSFAVVRTIDIGLLAAPFVFTLTPDERQLWVCNFGDNTISIIDTASARIVHTIAMPDGMPASVGFSPDGSKAYVSNLGPTSNFHYVPAIPKLAAQLANNGPGSLDIYDTKTLQRVDQIPVGRTPLFGIYPSA
ncbi:YncE family protein [Antrihabitans cavernicola]|uniref:YncE family protein n=1 Tax=Antrihabitans cavernicola TaxID=2495913 RepID=A0A5A7S9J1_9NOCA|nr:hypothetical protein [Spelaeibacter cavernicola]KAA0021929.1 hypothetical protein FOY51_16185 [Spelaeibacter cavernicola]